MDTELFLQAIRESLLAIAEPRFYETERGFQGQLLVELSKRIPDCLLADRAVIEQEYQKTLERHGIKLRPDIIIHQPFDPAVHANRLDGNFAVIALKLRAGPKKAAEDFADLESILAKLRYPIGVFINISHSRPQANYVPASARGKIVAFATRLTSDGARVVEARA
ncbi:hypothetical protein [Lysobacter sp. A289]